MGHAVEAAAHKQNIKITRVLDVGDKLDEITFEADEVVVDFTGKDALLANLPILMQKQALVVSGSTGWYDKLPEIKKMVEAAGKGAFLYASNFSIPTHMFWKIVEDAAKIMNNVPEMDAFVREIHHKMKADSPSGTAITLARKIIGNFKNKDTIFTDRLTRRIADNELHVSSSRGGVLFGEHEVWFDGPDDTVKITHVAKSRDGFAEGAISCAKWLLGKQGFFSIDDYICDLL